MALLKTYLEGNHPGLAERIAASHGIPAWKTWWRFRDVHSEFGLKFWAMIFGGGALGGAARAVLERAGIGGGSGLRHDGNQRADYSEPPLPCGARNHRQAHGGA